MQVKGWLMPMMRHHREPDNAVIKMDRCGYIFCPQTDNGKLFWLEIGHEVSRLVRIFDEAVAGTGVEVHVVDLLKDCNFLLRLLIEG